MKDFAAPFLKATLAGSLTASALPFLFALVIGLVSLATGEPTQAFVTFYVFIVVLSCIIAVVASTSLLIGLPISLLLKRLRFYTHKAHVMAGVALGFVTFPALLAATGGTNSDISLLLLYIYAALAGGVTADSWWRNTADRADQTITPA